MKNLIKYWYKFTNKKVYYDLKNTQNIEKSINLYKSKFEKSLNLIQDKIKNQKSLSFLHSGHIGDIINVLPVIKELSLTHECNLFININKPLERSHFAHQAGDVYLNKKIFDMLLPLFKSQKYIHSVNLYKDQNIDIDFDLIRKLPINLLFDNLRYGFQIAGIQPDIEQPYLNIEPHKKILNKIVILRSQRYKNQFISYNFIENYNDTLFVGTKEEYFELKKEISNLEFYECKDFLEMAQIIKASRFFLGNSSLGIDLAEATKVPRLLEACPGFPARQVHGKNSYDFYFQSHFEKYFKLLFDKTK